jgi:nuclear transport factor 2 (NTF2) superfamily protein
MAGILGTLNGSPWPTVRRAVGATGPSSSSAGSRSSRLFAQVGRELDYRLIKELWAFQGNRIAVRFAYEWHDDASNWFRSFGDENWEFDAQGLMMARHASINDVPIREEDRKFRWPLGRRPDDHPALSSFGF